MWCVMVSGRYGEQRGEAIIKREENRCSSIFSLVTHAGTRITRGFLCQSQPDIEGSSPLSLVVSI